MSRSRPIPTRWLVARLVPAVLLLGAIPLMAPTCGGSGGVQTFARSSLIIPMDLCYQSQSDGQSYTPFSCPQAADPGNVIRAYGLVYQLVRNNVAVYWVIAPAKAALTSPDLTIQYNPGVPAFLYDWASGTLAASTTPVTTATNHSVTYIGGPFVVDGSDFVRASQVLQQYKSLYGAVNVHVSNVAFQANVAKTMAGGWSAGGAVPPKLALLDIGSSGAGTKNSEVVIQGYLTQAGLDFPGAAGTATGPHGQIYDTLLMEDFFPDASGTVTSSRLFQNGYQILWVPHWAAPTSCSDCSGTSCSCSNKYTVAQIDTALKTMGAFSATGHDVFAECAGLGSFEGVVNNTVYKVGASDGSTHFDTTAAAGTAGMSAINTNTGSPNTAYFWPGNFSSPLLQLGDFPFAPAGGAIADFKSSIYKTETVRLVSDRDHTWDVFTLVPPSASHGTVVYLGGHSYSGTDGSFEIAGTRLVLNTLFNLGAACVSSGVACNTGELGVCSVGTMQCDPNTGLPKCVRTTGPSPEICDGKDNDCNGLVDDGLDTACYDGPAATRNVGICHDGVRSCVKNLDNTYGMSACQGQVLPATEVCNGLDDDCNGHVDDDPLASPAGSQPLHQACYTGPSTSLDPLTGYPRGICKAGIQTCASGVWGACPVCPANAWQTPASFPACEILPQTETCGTDAQGNQVDMNCNGIVADGCGCTPGATQSCYRGPSGTLNVGVCHAGTQTCQAGTPASWGACSGDVLPGPLNCAKPPNAVDNNCNGVPDYQEPGCNLCPPAGDPSLVCYDGPAGTLPTSASDPRVCRAGTRACSNGVLGACNGEILPSPEVCNGKDDNCNGIIDDGASCGPGLSCVNGACVPGTCGVETPCPEGYACTAGACVAAACGAGGVCPPGTTCRFGQCVDPCAGVVCGAGTVCASGTCTAGGCYNTGCPNGQICRHGACVANACVGLPACPAGTFCRAGDCVQACVFQTCPAGQACGVDGFCAPDPCASVSCSPDRLCVNGQCVANPCLGISCGPGLVCQNGACVDDPCAGVQCPAGACIGGQCYSTGAVGQLPDGHTSTTSCGCGSGPGAATSALLLLAALPLARRRRRGGAPRRVGGLAALAIAVALGGSGCKKTTDSFDPALCKVTCGEQRCVDLTTDPTHCATCDHLCAAGEICAASVCGPSGSVAPYVASSLPTQAPKGAVTTVSLTGERFQTGAEVRVIAPAGTTTYLASVSDPSHLTAILDFTATGTTSVSLRVVNADRVISNAVPFDVITPTPIITAVTPTSIPSGATQALTVTASGLLPTSQCHVKGPTVTDQAIPTTAPALGATSLVCTFATAGFPPGAYELWIVNEGTLASNHWAVQITGSGTAHLTSISPSAAATGDTLSVLVTGTGFVSTSVVTFDFNTGAGPVNQTTTFQDPNHLLVPSVTMPSTPGSITVSVIGANNFLTLTVSNTAPRADTMTVTPTPLYQGHVATLHFTGLNLAGATGGTIQPPVGAATTAALTTPAPTSTDVYLTLNLAAACGGPCPAGLYSAALAFPTGTSAAFQFLALSNVAVLLSASPAGAAQGASPTVTLSGSNFLCAPAGACATGAAILFTGNGVNQTLTPVAWNAPTPPNSATATLNLAGLNTGVYKLAVQNPGAAASNQVSFSVTPGPPSITTVSPGSVSQSTPVSSIPVTVTLTGTNFALPDANGNAASQVMVSADNGTTWGPLPAGNLVTVVNATTITIAFDPRTAIPASYLIQVWNPPGPQRSASVAFTVTP